MSTSTSDRVRLAVEAEDRLAEIFLVDSSFALAARGVGSLQVDVPRAIYKLKLRAGTRIEEEFLSLERGHEQILGSRSAEVTVTSNAVAVLFPRALFAASPPLSATSRAHEYHEAAAANESRTIHLSLGKGGQLFIFARRWTSRSPKAEAAAVTPASGLTLHAADGRMLVDFAQVARTGGADPWAACNVELTPGSYTLRRMLGSQLAVEQSMVVSPGWQTQLFLLWTPGREEPDTTVLMARLGSGFDPSDRRNRLAELARQALAEKRPTVPETDIEPLMHGKRDDPMLGIYAGHLLALSLDAPEKKGDRAREALGQVVRNLRLLVGPAHPDVEALALTLAPEPGRRFEVPPMLLRGWWSILERTATRPELVPVGSLASRIAPRLWGDGPWLLWRALPKPARAVPGESDDVTQVQDVLRSLAEAARHRLQPAKGALPEPTSMSPAQMVQVLGLPMAVVYKAVKGLGWSDFSPLWKPRPPETAAAAAIRKLRTVESTRFPTAPAPAPRARIDWGYRKPAIAIGLSGSRKKGAKSWAKPAAARAGARRKAAARAGARKAASRGSRSAGRKAAAKRRSRGRARAKARR
jgi:hypothetical protein